MAIEGERADGDDGDGSKEEVSSEKKSESGEVSEEKGVEGMSKESGNAINHQVVEQPAPFVSDPPTS